MKAEPKVVSKHFTYDSAVEACNRARTVGTSKHTGIRRSSGHAHLHYQVRRGKGFLRRWELIVR